MSQSEFFTRLVADLLGNDFLDRRLGQEVVLVDVGPEATAPLLTWADLNDLLVTRRPLAPQLRLYRQGTQVPVDSYAHVQGEGATRREIIQPDQLYAAMRDGASLILDAVNTLHPSVGAAAEDLMRFVRESVQANLYVTWGTSQGFDTHWDDHDTFIVQVMGSKQWTVHGPGRPFPMKRDVSHEHTYPDTVVWEGVLGAGQVLHVPRGWWHTVRGAGEMSVHLTFGFTRRTGLDWAEWVVEQLRHHELFRKDLPRFASPSEQQAHQDVLRAYLDKTLEDSPLATYFTHRDKLFPRRYCLSFPFPVTFTLPEDSTAIEFTPILEPEISEQERKVALSTAGKTFTFASVLTPLLRALDSKRRLSCGDLRQLSGLDDATFALALEILFEQHLVTIAAKPSTDNIPDH